MCPNTKSAYQRLLMDQIANGIPRAPPPPLFPGFPLSTFSTCLDPEKGFRTGRATHPPPLSANRNGNAPSDALAAHHPPVLSSLRSHVPAKRENSCCIVIYIYYIYIICFVIYIYIIHSNLERRCFYFPARPAGR